MSFASSTAATSAVRGARAITGSGRLDTFFKNLKDTHVER